MGVTNLTKVRHPKTNMYNNRTKSQLAYVGLKDICAGCRQCAITRKYVCLGAIATANVVVAICIHDRGLYLRHIGKEEGGRHGLDVLRWRRL